MIEMGVIVAVIIGVGQVIKNATPINAKYLPVINLVLGVILGVLFLSDDIKTNIFTGLIIGLTASGLFDTTKTVKASKSSAQG